MSFKSSAILVIFLTLSGDSKEVPDNVALLSRQKKDLKLKLTCDVNDGSECINSKDRAADLKEDFHLRRAQSYINNQRFHRALSDAEESLKIYHSSEAIEIKAKALIGLARYEEALLLFQNSNEDLAAHCKKLLIQQKTGKYNIIQMRKKLRKNPLYNFTGEIAEKFISPNINISPDIGGGKGRGILASSTIKAGTLLAASKAFSLVHKSKNPEPILINQVSEILQIEPERRSELYEIYAGPKLGYIEPSQDLPEFDLTRIKAICHNTGFYSRESYGIWAFPSLFNNDCLDNNAHVEILGDFLFIRAIKKIKPGDEVTINYSKYMEQSSINDLFNCSCRLCQAKRSEPLEIRKKLEMELKEAEKNKDFQKMLNLINERMQEISSKPELKILLIPYLFKLERIFTRSGDPSKGIEILMEILRILKESNFTSPNEKYRALLTLNVLLAQVDFNRMPEIKEEFLYWMKKLMREAKIHFGTAQIIRFDDRKGFMLIEEALERLHAQNLLAQLKSNE